MPRLFQPVQPQQLFETPKEYQPSANRLASVDETFRSTVADRVNTDYSSLASQYENKQITDQDFSTGVDLLVQRIAEPTLKKQWEPVVGEAKYLVLSNAQALTDSKIQTDLNTGAISPQDAINRYNELANASLNFNTQSSLKDAAAWSLKASAITAALKKSSSRGPGREPKNLDDLKRQYESKKFSLDQDQAELNSQLSELDSWVESGAVTKEDGNLLRQDLLDQYYNSVSSFGYDGDVLDYISEVDPNSGYSYLNNQIDYAKSLGLPTPGYFTGYQSGLDTLAAEEAARQAAYEAENPLPSLSDLLSGMVGQSSLGPRIQGSETSSVPPQSPPPVRLVAPESQRQSNPLGLGTGGPVNL